MLGLTRIRRTAAPVRSRSIRPRLEELESRLCLSSGNDLGLTINYSFVNQNNVKLTGTYTGSNVVNQGITIQGQGWSASTTTDAHGSYSVTTAATKLGTVTAWVTQKPGVQAQTTLSAPVPQITNFVAIQQGSGLWEFKGTVTGTPDPAGMTITFGGLSNIAGATTTVLADGTFDVVLTVGAQQGYVTAVTTDWWSQTSPQALTYV
jgi:hypothetical protein